MMHDEQEAEARALLRDLRKCRSGAGVCACGELMEGGFEQCWNCGAMMPDARAPDAPRYFQRTGSMSTCCCAVAQHQRAFLHRGLQLHAALRQRRERLRGRRRHAAHAQVAQARELVLDAAPPDLGGVVEAVDA